MRFPSIGSSRDEGDDDDDHTEDFGFRHRYPDDVSTISDSFDVMNIESSGFGDKLRNDPNHASAVTATSHPNDGSTARVKKDATAQTMATALKEDASAPAQSSKKTDTTNGPATVEDALLVKSLREECHFWKHLYLAQIGVAVDAKEEANGLYGGSLQRVMDSLVETNRELKEANTKQRIQVANLKGKLEMANRIMKNTQDTSDPQQQDNKIRESATTTTCEETATDLRAELDTVVEVVRAQGAVLSEITTKTNVGMESLSARLDDLVDSTKDQIETFKQDAAIDMKENASRTNIWIESLSSRMDELAGPTKDQIDMFKQDRAKEMETISTQASIAMENLSSRLDDLAGSTKDQIETFKQDATVQREAFEAYIQILQQFNAEQKSSEYKPNDEDDTMEALSSKPEESATSDAFSCGVQEETSEECKMLQQEVSINRTVCNGRNDRCNKEQERIQQCCLKLDRQMCTLTENVKALKSSVTQIEQGAVGKEPSDSQKRLDNQEATINQLSSKLEEQVSLLAKSATLLGGGLEARLANVEKESSGAIDRLSFQVEGLVSSTASLQKEQTDQTKALEARIQLLTAHMDRAIDRRLSRVVEGDAHNNFAAKKQSDQDPPSQCLAEPNKIAQGDCANILQRDDGDSSCAYSSGHVVSSFDVPAKYLANCPAVIKTGTHKWSVRIEELLEGGTLCLGVVSVGSSTLVADHGLGSGYYASDGLVYRLENGSLQGRLDVPPISAGSHVRFRFKCDKMGGTLSFSIDGGSWYKVGHVLIDAVGVLPGVTLSGAEVTFLNDYQSSS